MSQYVLLKTWSHFYEVPSCGNKINRSSRTTFYRLPFSYPERLIWLVVLRIDVNSKSTSLGWPLGLWDVFCESDFSTTVQQKCNQDTKHRYLNNIAVPHVGPVVLQSSWAKFFQCLTNQRNPCLGPLGHLLVTRLSWPFINWDRSPICSSSTVIV